MTAQTEIQPNNPYRQSVDWVTVLIYLLLVAFGWFNLYAANYNPETKVFFTTDAEYFKQLMWMGVTVALVSVMFMMDSRIFVEFAYIIYYVSLFLLLLTLFVGKEVNGAKAWLGAGAVQFQPVELTKIGATLVVSRIMSRYNFRFNFTALAKLGVVLMVPILFVLLQNDTGSALIFMVLVLPMFREGLTGHVLITAAVCAAVAIASLLTDDVYVMPALLALAAVVLAFRLLRVGMRNVFFSFLAMTLLGGAGAWVAQRFTQAQVRYEYVFLAAGALGSAQLLAVSFVKRIKHLRIIVMYLCLGLVMAFATSYIFENVLIEHQRTRINILFGIEDDPLGAGYNVNQSLIAIGSGELLGKGFLEGTQTKLNFVPKQTTDFIFCTVGEEWGFVGCAALIVIYLAFFYRIIHLAEKQHSVFSRVYGYCIASIFFFHFAVNICMTIGLMPVIGIPLPFFSYGGSSFLGFSLMLFVFLKLDTSRNELIR